MRKIQIHWNENKEVSGHETANFRVQNEWKKAGVYVIVVDGGIEYVGQTMNIQRRINDGYGNICPANFGINGRRTNVAVNAKIVEARSNGKQVEIFFGEIENREEIEKIMINQIHPAWNKI
tara:strand:+ start:5918 stop:6280 length:363 start_codon:yes stop_codon:yes gene_type:complete